MINMQGLNWTAGPEGGIYLMGHDTSADEVARGGGGMLGSQKIKGWDGGRFVPGDCKTSAEALAATGLDWTVSKHPIVKVDPIYGVDADGNPGVIGWEPRRTDEPTQTSKRTQANKLPTGGYDIVRAYCQNVREDTGEVLGIVGPGWQGVQNHESFSFVDDLVDSGDAKWLGGGMKGGGAKIWMCAQLDRGVMLGGDENELSVPLMFIQNGWDGYMSYTITCAPYRLACVNGQSIPLEGFVRSWKGRHTSSLTADARLKVARESLELSIGYFDAWANEMEHLMTQTISARQADRIVHKLFPDPKPAKDGDEPGKRSIVNVEARRDAVLTIYRDAPDQQNIKGSKYGLLNAVTAYVDWHTKCLAEDQVIRSAEPHALKDKAFALLSA